MRYANTDAVPILDGKPDVVEVVRCRECKHIRKSGDYYYCEHFDTDSAYEVVPVEENDFCSYGERREK